MNSHSNSEFSPKKDLSFVELTVGVAGAHSCKSKVSMSKGITNSKPVKTCSPTWMTSTLHALPSGQGPCSLRSPPRCAAPPTSGSTSVKLALGTRPVKNLPRSSPSSQRLPVQSRGQEVGPCQHKSKASPSSAPHSGIGTLSQQRSPASRTTTPCSSNAFQLFRICKVPGCSSCSALCRGATISSVPSPLPPQRPMRPRMTMRCSGASRSCSALLGSTVAFLSQAAERSFPSTSAGSACALPPHLVPPHIGHLGPTLCPLSERATPTCLRAFCPL